jgi:two-component system, OmpR family, KDP operon response regulator KdpE
MNRKKILVVDDNEVILKTLSLKLSASNYEVFTATDGSEAVGAVRRHKPDLILLDIGFPPEVAGVHWDGFRIIQWLRRVEESKNVPVIIISGTEAAKYKDKALAEGACAYFQKPINHDELIAAMRQILEPSAASADAAPA